MDSERGASQVTGAEELLVQDTKDKLCCVCLRLKEEMTKNPSNNQGFNCPENLFHPSDFGTELAGIAKFCSKSIMNELLSCWHKDFHSSPFLYFQVASSLELS
ncbi:hypothetical protein Nmel_011905 [Mimus melanotis]